MKIYLDRNSPVDDERVRADLLRASNESNYKSTWDKYIRDTRRIQERYRVKRAIVEAFFEVCLVGVVVFWIYEVLK
jgi:hypothetical protein